MNRRLWVNLVVGSLALASTASGAQASSYAIPAGDLETALKSWASQSGRQVVYKSDEVARVQTKGVRKKVSADAALEELLSSTGFVAQADSTSAVAIVRLSAVTSQSEDSVPVATTPAAAQDVEITEIVVTGSRIKRSDLEATSPVAVIGADTLKDNNAVDVETYLKQSPQFLAAAGSNSNLPGPGVATLDLRGLGAQRTLVLVDGKRMPSFDLTGVADVNSIPQALLRRVDVLSGGASAVYGSDAISGVVNFILDDRFTGLKFDAGSAVSEKGDGEQYNGSVTAGFEIGDRGNIIVSANWTKRGAATFSDRPRNATSLNAYDDLQFAGSSFTSPTVFVNTFNPASPAPLYQLGPNGEMLPSVYQLDNITEYLVAQIPSERYNIFTLGRFELTSSTELFARASYGHGTVDIISPPASMGVPFNISPDNPFLTAEQRALFFGPQARLNSDGTASISVRRRMNEAGARYADYDNNNYQVVGGVRGTFGDGYSWEVFSQYGESRRTTNTYDGISSSRITQAVDAVATADGAACRNPANGCVAVNLFSAAPLSDAALDFILMDANSLEKTSQFVSGANIGGDVAFLKSPWATQPAAALVGVEYRREQGETIPDPIVISGDSLTFGRSQITSGSYNVKEAYTEVKMPIVTDRPFVDAFNIEGAFRYSDYSTAGAVSTYRGGADWTPVSGFRFRGNYQRAVRAPNISEIFTPAAYGLGALAVDPCAGPDVTAGTALGDLCVATGAPAGSLGRIEGPRTGTTNAIFGGNRNLDVEESDTYTAGIVINPPSLPALALSVDYFSVEIANAINTFGGSVGNIVNTCYNIARDASSPFCQAIRRDPSTGALDGSREYGVYQVLTNIATLKTTGFDVFVGYQGAVRDLSYSLSLNGTYLDSYEVQADPASTAYSCQGIFSSTCGLNPLPRWKHIANLDIDYGPVTFHTQWRFIGNVDAGQADISRGLAVDHISSYSYFDETVSYDVTDTMVLRVGVQNVLDKKPPIVGDNVGILINRGNTFPSMYDVIGRNFFVGFSASLR